MSLTRVIWTNRQGERRQHSLGFRSSLSYARDWWRRSILECQGVLSRDEARASQLRLVAVEDFEGGTRWEPRRGDFQ